MADDYDDQDQEQPLPPRAPGEGVRIIGAEEAASKLESGEAQGRRQGEPRFGDVPPSPAGPRPSHRFPLPEHAEALPHWTEPPTGEVPRILPEAEEPEDDIESWSGHGSRAPRWRDQRSDWDEADFDDDALLHDDETRVGALDPDRHEPAPWSFDEEEDELEPAPEPAVRVSSSRPGPATTRVSSRRVDPFGPGDPYGTERRDERNLPVAVITGVAVGVGALLAFWLGPGWAAALVTVIVSLAAVEVFDVFRRAGYRPATLLGLVATVALLLATFFQGERAVPLVLALTVVFSMLWYLGGVVRARPTINVGITLLGFLWIGFLGSFGTLLLRHPNDEGIAFLLGAVIATVANDVGALFSGRQWGRTPLAPQISPNKTVEGFLGGLVVSLVVSAAVVSRVSPWDLGSALALAAVVSVVAPVGDLCESMFKRDIGVKDMGSILPGHGGVLDRFDAMLFALPAVYYLVELLDLPTV